MVAPPSAKPVLVLTKFAPVFRNRFEITAFQGADVEHHVQFGSTFSNGILGFKRFGTRLYGTQRKPHHRTDRHIAALEFSGDIGDIGRINTYSLKVVRYGLGTQLGQRLKCGSRLKQRVIDILSHFRSRGGCIHHYPSFKVWHIMRIIVYFLAKKYFHHKGTKFTKGLDNCVLKISFHVLRDLRG
jgi:hypothetical protein